MPKNPRLLLFGGALLALAGIYELYVGATMPKEPTVLSITEFEKHPPSNLQVIITGGYFDPNPQHSVKYSLSNGVGDTHPNVKYYVPLGDAPFSGEAGRPPRVVVEISEFEMKQIGRSINSARIAGLRQWHWELPRAVQDEMRKNFGSAVDDMILVSYGVTPMNRVFGFVLLIMAGGSCLLAILPIGSRY